MHHVQTSFRGTIWLSALAAVLAAAAVLWQSPSYQATSGFRPNPPGSDFFQEWIGGRILLDGDAERLYDWEYSRRLQHDSRRTGFDWPADEYYPMVYPPFYYAAVAPLAWFDCLTAARIWCGLNGIAYCLAFVLLASHCLRFSSQARWFPLLAVLYAPVLLSLNMGQKSGFLLLLFVATYTWQAQGRSWLAGLIFGGVLFKPQLAVVLLLAMVWRRDWRFLGGFATSAVLAALASLAVGRGPCLDFLHVVSAAGRYMEHGGYQWEHAHNLWCGVRGLFPPQRLGLAAGTFGLIACLLCGAVGRTRQRACPPDSLEYGEWFGQVVLLTILLSPHFFTYDLSLLLVPMALVACRIWNSPTPTDSPASRSARGIMPAGGLVLFVAAMFVASTWLPAVAAWTGVQWSCWILAGWLLVWARVAREDLARRREPTRAHHGAGGGVPRGVAEPLC